MTQVQTLLILPVILLVLHTFIIMFTMGYKRFTAAKARQVDARYYKLYQEGSEPEALRKLSRNFQNLFELPVLFYLAIVVTLVLKMESMLFVYLASGYVLLRIVHSFVHCTSNKVLWRFRIFVLSSLVLLAYWIIFLIRILA